MLQKKNPLIYVSRCLHCSFHDVGLKIEEHLDMNGSPITNGIIRALISRILLFLNISGPAPAVLNTGEQETPLYCPVLCHRFLSLFLLLLIKPDHFLLLSTSTSSSLYSDKVSTASVCLPCSSSGICALHKYLFASMAVLYWQRGREGGRVCPHRCMCYCFLLFWAGQCGDTVAHLEAWLHPSCS